MKHLNETATTSDVHFFLLVLTLGTNGSRDTARRIAGFDKGIANEVDSFKRRHRTANGK
jgi:hypothetical protein